MAAPGRGSERGRGGRRVGARGREPPEVQAPGPPVQDHVLLMPAAAEDGRGPQHIQHVLLPPRGHPVGARRLLLRRPGGVAGAPLREPGGVPGVPLGRPPPRGRGGRALRVCIHSRDRVPVQRHQPRDIQQAGEELSPRLAPAARRVELERQLGGGGRLVHGHLRQPRQPVHRRGHHQHRPVRQPEHPRRPPQCPGAQLHHRGRRVRPPRRHGRRPARPRARAWREDCLLPRRRPQAVVQVLADRSCRGGANEESLPRRNTQDLPRRGGSPGAVLRRVFPRPDDNERPVTAARVRPGTSRGAARAGNGVSRRAAPAHALLSGLLHWNAGPERVENPLASEPHMKNQV
mmetsp:Transcript_24098/g.57397  ORF Transcript_24098/g.57397 Transcript_24098/m.57397 type:complete len:347 (+) Transcript_24098:710-1750(+)